ncbi:nicotinamide riboside transporter PnuC [Acinetobacter junii]|uniref:nicotinamide riboside transporter PnuC n=1 Tax=Acinetobacter junii TaxID=40215 RepID=UPI001FB37CA7|nr:nicotinamide riboside transporter PnuC [Acinetobacter junii]UOB51670.1 nicotinamide riboside transporter PnuC [Acinetobacter junii]
MSNLEIFAVLISIIGVSLTIKRNMWCWGFNVFACVLYAYLFLNFKLYGETILQFFFVGMNLYGLYVWLTGKRQDHEIRVETINIKSMYLHIILASIGGLCFGMFLKQFTDASVPMLDSQLAAFSLLGTYWTSRKYIETWILWIVVDIVYVAMFIYKELLLTAGLYAVFVGLAAYGWWQWQQVKRNKIAM